MDLTRARATKIKYDPLRKLRRLNEAPYGSARHRIREMPTVFGNTLRELDGNGSGS